ncbi:hypothetical protein ACFE04_024461 [Oxalis oulophora]
MKLNSSSSSFSSLSSSYSVSLKSIILSLFSLLPSSISSSSPSSKYGINSMSQVYASSSATAKPPMESIIPSTTTKPVKKIFVKEPLDPILPSSLPLRHMARYLDFFHVIASGSYLVFGIC